MTVTISMMTREMAMLLASRMPPAAEIADGPPVDQLHIEFAPEDKNAFERLSLDDVTSEYLAPAADKLVSALGGKRLCAASPPSGNAVDGHVSVYSGVSVRGVEFYQMFYRPDEDDPERIVRRFDVFVAA